MSPTEQLPWVMKWLLTSPTNVWSGPNSITTLAHVPFMHCWLTAHAFPHPPQLALSARVPSSHPSPPLMLQSPKPAAHCSEQSGPHVAFGGLPPSHASTPACTKVSPQAAATQVSRQASLLSALPSS